jgi:hypothetical protein
MRAVGFHHVGFAVLITLAGCGRSIVQMGERAAWRQEAEVACLKSGAVPQTPGIVRIDPIEGPGVCGADYPLKVAAFGNGSAFGFVDELRPPGRIPGASNFPIAAPRSVAPPPRYAPPSDVLAGPPLSLTPPSEALLPRGNEARGYEARGYEVPLSPPQTTVPRYAQPPANYAPSRADDIPDDALLPDRSRAARPNWTSPPPQRTRDIPPRDLPRLGPVRRQMVTGAIKTAVTPPATLACPIVSALDRWIMEAVQPAAMRWFRQPVTGIKQISAYSCRGMVGNSSPRISEHAFGNALDIAAFVLADGRKVTVKSGWNGTPEETGFLHDVQLAACERFTTVLGPGYNVYHYDHIHLDLIRRASGRAACKPRAISGEVAAARQLQKAKYAHRGGQLVTGSVAAVSAMRQRAVPGADGYFDENDDNSTVTGSIPETAAKAPIAIPGQDGYFEDE